MGDLKKSGNINNNIIEDEEINEEIKLNISEKQKIEQLRKYIKLFVEQQKLKKREDK